MNLRTLVFPSVMLAATLAAAQCAFGLGLELGESKEELKLKYDVSVTDHGTGRVTVILTIEDEGRLKPLSRGVDLIIPSKDGTGYVDLAVSLDRQLEDGKQVIRVQLRKELAEQGEIHLKTDHLDGKQQPLTWYYHRIPMAAYLKAAAEKTKKPQ
jgi:hypothetical protein